jgi:hypothetical protein
VLSFNSIRNLSLAAVMLSMSPIAGCHDPSTESDDEQIEGRDDFEADDTEGDVAEATSELTASGLPVRFHATLQNASRDGVTNECLIFYGTAQGESPSRYMWGSDNGHCGLPSKAYLLDNQQAVFRFDSQGGDRYTITHVRGGSSGCLMFYGGGSGENPTRYSWGSDNGMCGFSSRPGLFSSNQAVWKVTNRGGGKFTIHDALTNQCLIFAGNGQNTYMSRHLWPHGPADLCGWDTSANLLANKQAVFTITVQQELAPLPATTPMGNFFRDPAGAKPALSYDRGAGTVPSDCGGQQNDAGLCYPYCAGGYTGVGPVCWGSCPAGYRDDGATCFRDAEIISANTSSCPWYDVCGVTFAQGCSSCPGGYVNDGCTCRRDAHTVAKPSYGRGAGTTPSICPAGKVNEAGLCYTPCQPSYKGVGPVCWIDNIDQAFCANLYDPAIAGAAADANLTMSFGIGAGIAAGNSVGAETGIVYGQAGEYGCYTSVCTGVVTDASINAWGAAGIYLDYASFTGDAISTFQGVSAKFAGFQTAQVWDTQTGQLIGTTDQVSLGVGLSPIQVGAQTCTTNVLRLF